MYNAVVVLGPTACGKTAVGVGIAARCNGEVVSADSRQVYRHLDLGTGKVTPEERIWGSIRLRRLPETGFRFPTI